MFYSMALFSLLLLETIVCLSPSFIDNDIKISVYTFDPFF